MNIEVNLSDFDNDEIEDHARDHLDMIKRSNISLYKDFSICEIEDFLKAEGYAINSKFFYPNNSITTNSAYKTLLDNVDKIPLSEIESLITKYNCI